MIEEKKLEAQQQSLSLELKQLINLSKSDMTEEVQTAVLAIDGGWIDPIEGLIYAAKGKSLFELLEKNLRPLAEVKSVGKEGLIKFGCEIKEKMNGVSTDYTPCQDPEWVNLQIQLGELKAKIKERETFLSSLTKSITLADEETGEMITIHPPVKSGKLGFAISIK